MTKELDFVLRLDNTIQYNTIIYLHFLLKFLLMTLAIREMYFVLFFDCKAVTTLRWGGGGGGN